MMTSSGASRDRGHRLCHHHPSSGETEDHGRLRPEVLEALCQKASGMVSVLEEHCR